MDITVKRLFAEWWAVCQVHSIRHSTKNHFAECRTETLGKNTLDKNWLCRVPQKYIRQRVLSHMSKSKLSASFLVCYFLALGELTCLLSVFFGIRQTRYLLSALDKEKLKSYFEVVN
jgi:hypothetical protein